MSMNMAQIPSAISRKNRYSEVLSDGDCIIYSKNASFLFIFHDYTSIVSASAILAS